jgi:hydroxyacylglutathione hydrolase
VTYPEKKTKMPYDIITIGAIGVNCYLVKANDGYFLVDTGFPFTRGALKKALGKAGCEPGNLKLVVITHGDYDHTGNAAFLQKKYGVKVAVHRNEAGAVERGDMSSNRKMKLKTFIKIVMAISKLLAFRPFKPDIYLETEPDLNEYGVNAKIIHIPGHTVGSVGVLTIDGDFFCGDLFNSTRRPRKNSLIDDEAEMDASIEKLKTLDIKKIYPGHGRPFTMDEFIKNNPK